MIQHEETEWPTFESILYEVRNEHALERAAREAAVERAAQEAVTADLLVAERDVAEPDTSDDEIFVEDLIVGDSAVSETGTEDPAVEDATVDDRFTEPTIEQASPPSLFPSGSHVEHHEPLDFVPQDEPVIETTSAEFIATPRSIGDSPSFFNQVASEAEEVQEVQEVKEVKNPATDASLNPFDPQFEGIAEDVVDDDSAEWVSHSLSGVVPTQIESVPEDKSVTPLTPFEQPIDIGSVEGTITNADSYGGDDLWDLDQEEQGGVVIPLRQPEPVEPDLSLIGLDKDLPDKAPQAPGEAPTAGSTFALRPNVFTSGQVAEERLQQNDQTGELFTPRANLPAPIGAIPVADPTIPTPGVKPDDPWSTMRPKGQPEKITFWENRPKFFGGDDRRRARAQREAATTQEVAPSQQAQERNCPNCGARCRVDVHDKALNRLHLSCNSCRHMWVEDGA